MYKEEFFDPNDLESFETYKSCLMGKLTKTLFTRHREKENKLLDLIIKMIIDI